MDGKLKQYLQKATGQCACLRDRLRELSNQKLSDEVGAIVERLKQIERGLRLVALVDDYQSSSVDGVYRNWGVEAV